jgi:dethiobiotin synthetase
VRIDAKKIVRAVREACAAYDTVLVEGSGGLLVPIDTKRTLLDVAQEIGLPVLLVAANRLGVINHTLLSLNELARRGMRCAGVVFNATDPKLPQEIAEDNPRIVKAHGGVTVLGALPFMMTKQTGDAECRIFVDIVKKVRGYGLKRA